MQVNAQEIKPLNLPELDNMVKAFADQMGFGPQKGDDKLNVEFIESAEPSEFLSKKEMRPVVRECVVCLIGFKDNDERYNCVSHAVVDGNVHTLASRFPVAYERFLTRKQAREKGDIKQLDIPLAVLALTPVQETTLRMYGLNSVQRIAREVPEKTVVVLDGFSEIIERAKRVLDAIGGAREEAPKQEKKVK